MSYLPHFSYEDALRDPDVINQLHKEIEECIECESSDGYAKPLPLFRGHSGILMIVGEGPGRTEVTSGRAFSGQSGTRLNEWLVMAGADAKDPRNNVYLTSVIKCVCSTGAYSKLKTNCRKYLIKQIDIIEPAIIWTLGEKAYSAIGVSSKLYRDALFNVFSPSDVLITEWTKKTIIIPLPHPSGMNRLLNEQEIRNKLNDALITTKTILEQAGRRL